MIFFDYILARLRKKDTGGVVDPALTDEILDDILTLYATKRDKVAQKNSIEDDAGYLQLVGDENSPGPNKIYSTDAGGNRGWHSTLLTTGLFAQTSDGVVVTNTQVETNIIGSGQGSLSVPANGFKVGDSFEAVLSGIISTENNHYLTINVKSGSQILATTLGILMSHCANQPFQIRITFTIKSIGVNGEVSTFGSFTYNNNQIELKGVMFTDNEVLNTTIQNTLQVTAQWSQTDTHDSIQCKNFTLHKTY